MCGVSNRVLYNGTFRWSNDSLILLRPRQQNLINKLDKLQFKYANLSNEPYAAIQSYGLKTVLLPLGETIVYRKSGDTLDKRVNGASLVVSLIRAPK
jgi:hypothetical protein